MGAMKDLLYDEAHELARRTRKEETNILKEWEEDKEQNWNNFVLKTVRSIKK